MSIDMVDYHCSVNELGENRLLETLRFGHKCTAQELQELVFKSNLMHYNQARQTVFSYLHNYQNSITEKILDNKEWFDYILDKIDYKHQTGNGYNAAMIAIKDIKEKKIKILTNQQIDNIIDKTILRQLTSYSVNILGLALAKCSEGDLSEYAWKKIAKAELVNNKLVYLLDNYAEIEFWEPFKVLTKYIDNPHKLLQLIEQKDGVQHLKENKEYIIWKERLLLYESVEDRQICNKIHKI